MPRSRPCRAKYAVSAHSKSASVMPGSQRTRSAMGAKNCKELQRKHSRAAKNCKRESTQMKVQRGVHTLFKDCAHHSLKTAHVVLKTARELKTARSIWKYPETLEYRTKYNQPFRKYNKQTVSRTHLKTIISMEFNFQKIIFGVNFDKQNNRNKDNS